MSLDQRDRIEAAVCVLILAAFLAVAGVYFIGRYLLVELFKIF